MGYVEGTPIDVCADELDLPARLGLFLQVCDAVSYAHRNLIIHRDLKPSNILVDSEGHAKLLDFGIARMLEAGHSRSHTAERQLTPEYASPEQLLGGMQTTATDAYSLGIVLRRLLSGPSKATAPHEPGLPRDLECVIAKALAADARQAGVPAPRRRRDGLECLAASQQAPRRSAPIVTPNPCLLTAWRRNSAPSCNLLARRRWVGGRRCGSCCLASGGWSRIRARPSRSGVRWSWCRGS